MRLWSLHPTYLDSKGLVALWREGLLAKAVLGGRTRGYKNHPQLQRFQNHPDPQAAINAYLWAVYEEAERRGFQFDPSKLDMNSSHIKILVTEGQLRYEWERLQKKLSIRDEQQCQKNASSHEIVPHPSIEVVPGTIESWERTSG
jgi:Pyrimidine dimer DNA glycosylase